MSLTRFISAALLAAAIGSAIAAPHAEACDTCACAFNSKKAKTGGSSGAFITTPTASTMGKGRASVGFLFEHQRYNKIPAADAHALHHETPRTLIRRTSTDCGSKRVGDILRR